MSSNKRPIYYVYPNKNGDCRPVQINCGDGPTGYTGYTGPAGGASSTGATGATGYTGYTGYTGTTGYTGDTGNTGATGYTGAAFSTSYTVSPIQTSSFSIPSTSVSANYYDIYQIDSSLGPITITLPAINTLIKREIYICDVGGSLGVNNVVIQTTGSDLIANTSSMTLVVNYSSVHLISNYGVSSPYRWLNL
jgi:hypothetical protein